MDQIDLFTQAFEALDDTSVVSPPKEQPPKPRLEEDPFKPASDASVQRNATKAEVINAKVDELMARKYASYEEKTHLTSNLHPVQSTPAFSQIGSIPTVDGINQVAARQLNELISLHPSLQYQLTQYPTSQPSGVYYRGDSLKKASSTSQSTERLPAPSVSDIWNTGSLHLTGKKDPSSTDGDGDDEQVELEEELGYADTYNDYMPSKLMIGGAHPDPVVESASLASVEPPDVRYSLNLPQHIIDSGELSALQLEAVVYASQRHMTHLTSGERAGFLIGDGAGVGKGRTIAGVIYENWLCGRKRHLWFSVSSDLKVDSERDLGDIGAAKIDVFALNKMKYAKINSQANGHVKKGVIYATYSSLIGESSTTSSRGCNSRLKQLLQWCGPEFDGCIIFDECHRAKNLVPSGSGKPTKTGIAVLELQAKLPNARVVYSSATGATEPRNMAYMTRLGLWGEGTSFREFSDFISAVEKRGVGAMELVAMEMKMRGMYIARQLSFKGVSFQIDEIPVDQSFIRLYDKSVELWRLAREAFSKALFLFESVSAKHTWGQFWSAHQRFFRYLCISAKVRHCVSLARQAVKQGKCAVIGLQSTGEARTLEQLEACGGELQDFVSTAKAVMETLIQKHFPSPDKKDSGQDWSFLDEDDFEEVLDGVLAEQQSKDSGVSSSSKSLPKSKKSSYGKKRVAASKGADFYKEQRLSDDDDSNSGSDFKPSDSESSGEESDSSGSNPNEDDSDEDLPWLKSRKAASTGQESQTNGNNTDNKQTTKSRKRRRSPESSGDDDDELTRMVKKKLNQRRGKQLQKSWLDQQRNLDLNLTHSISVPNINTDRAPTAASVDEALRLKQALLDELERISSSLPPNTLDHLIDLLGGPDVVAELTGRKGRVVTSDSGSVHYESRREANVSLELLNLEEKRRFMEGSKLIAIISEAASNGISLQADRRVRNTRRRVHITLELPWSADRAIQQFGRTHRSNQVSAPEYLFLISKLSGEQRFAATVAKRLESLGALTHGDRRATESRDLSRFNLDNKFGRTALEMTLKTFVGQDKSPVPMPDASNGGYCGGDFLKDSLHALDAVGLLTYNTAHPIPTLDDNAATLPKFLNRLLGCPVQLQNAIFQYFTDNLHYVVVEAKKQGKWDLGILDLGATGERLRIGDKRSFRAANGAITKLHTVLVERGFSWDAAVDKWREYTGPDDGFYLSTSAPLGSTKKVAILCVCVMGAKRRDGDERRFNVYRPNLGLLPNKWTIRDVKLRYKKVVADEAQVYWVDQYQASDTMCSHKFWRNSCRRENSGVPCDIGIRTKTRFVLSGSVLNVWNKIEEVFSRSHGAGKMQVVRMKTDENCRVVGTLIPPQCVQHLCDVLRSANSAPVVQTNRSHIPAYDDAIYISD